MNKGESSITEYIESKDNEFMKNKLKLHLSKIIEMLPEENADLFIHTLSLLDEDAQKKIISFYKDDNVINNKTLMIQVFGLLMSQKTLGDAIAAAKAAEGVLEQSVPKIIQAHLKDLEESLLVISSHSIQELEEMYAKLGHSVEKFSKSLETGNDYVNTQFKILETAYESRAKNLDQRFKDNETAFSNAMTKLEEQRKAIIEDARNIAFTNASTKITDAVIPKL